MFLKTSTRCVPSQASISPLLHQPDIRCTVEMQSVPASASSDATHAGPTYDGSRALRHAYPTANVDTGSSRVRWIGSQQISSGMRTVLRSRA
jgi:hypothetical protein